MKIYITLICLAFVSFNAMAQPLSTVTPDLMYEVAEEQLALEDHYNALEWYKKAYKEDKRIEGAYQIAELHYLLRDYANAEKSYARLLKKDKDGQYANSRFEYGRVLKMNGKYDEAIKVLSGYIATSGDELKVQMAKIEIAGAKMVSSMVKENNVVVENMGKKVNHSSFDGSPVMVGTEDLYYTALENNEATVIGSKDGAYETKVYLAKKKDGKWLRGKPVDKNINREGFHVGNIALSKDGNYMYFTRQLLKGNTIASSRIYVSEKGGDSWLSAKEVSGINGDYIAKQPVVGELYGKPVIFFVSNMDGGHGGNDIYYATLTDAGSTEAPRNLGEGLNTIGDEVTPYYNDGILYFSSTGYPGMGGLDVFSSEWNGTAWSTPMNVGPDYNSSYDDLYFRLDAEGYDGFMTSNRPGGRSLKSKTCCDDIFSVSKERVVVNLLASVYTGGKGIRNTNMQLVEVVNNAYGKTDDKTNAAGNDYQFVLEREKSYAVIVTKEGYYPDTITFNTVGIEKSMDISKKLDLKPIPLPPPPPPKEEVVIIKINEPIALNNIYYDFNDDKILPAAEGDLQYLYKILTDYPDIKIELSSHTDSQGKNAYNKTLSQRRADSALAYLQNLGLDPLRVVAVGYGEDVIINQCTNGVKCSDDEHRVNRRTEFKITDGPTEIVIEKRKVVKQ